MSELLEMLAAAGSGGRRRGGDRHEPPASPPEVLCVTLREVAERYAAPCPFKVGDLVTPRQGSTYTGAGLPHVVIEVASEPIRAIGGVGREIASHTFGQRLDVRIACETDGCITAFWQESWQLEPYTGPGAQPEEPKAA